MNREQLIEKIVTATGLAAYDADRMIDIIVRMIARLTASGEKVKLRDFGTFTREFNKRKGKYSVKFEPSEFFQGLIDGTGK